MRDSYIPKLSMENPFRQFNTDISVGHITKSNLDGINGGPSFKDVMVDTLGQVSKVAGAPDVLMKEAMTTGNVDVHDVMIANAKAELAINVATQFTTKIVQAYDRILQIQI